MSSTKRVTCGDLDIHEGDIGPAGERGLDGRAAVTGFRDHNDAGCRFQHSADAGPDEGIHA
jgi:hypothetical protein